jgi:hypothetical protein
MAIGYSLGMPVMREPFFLEPFSPAYSFFAALTLNSFVNRVDKSSRRP